MKSKIVIEFDTEKKVIHSIDVADGVSPLDVAKILMSISLTHLNKIDLKPENKIKVIQPKIEVIK